MANPVPVTTLYGALTILLVTCWGQNISRLRVRLKIYVGDRGTPKLTSAVRAHGNAAEWCARAAALDVRRARGRAQACRCTSSAAGFLLGQRAPRRRLVREGAAGEGRGAA